MVFQVFYIEHLGIERDKGPVLGCLIRWGRGVFHIEQLQFFGKTLLSLELFFLKFTVPEAIGRGFDFQVFYVEHSDLKGAQSRGWFSKSGQIHCFEVSFRICSYHKRRRKGCEIYYIFILFVRLGSEFCSKG